MEVVLIALVAGAVVGWLGSVLVRGAGYGLQGDIIAGIVGAFIGNYLLAKLGLFIGGGYIAESINALIGAIVAVAAVKLIKRA
jgi:uncharacterized membrane protein YeaQ/YmgE (transglycosylase-associated protein family)